MATLNDEEQRHIEEVRLEDRRRLKVLERQVAGYGDLDAPPHLITQIEDLRFKLGLTGRMVRGETSEEFLGFMRQFGEQQALGRAITDVDRKLYEFKKETWDYRERDQVARNERQEKNDKEFAAIKTEVQRLARRIAWIGLFILGVLIWIVARSF